MSETTIRVPLTIEQRADKAGVMARLIKQIAGIEAEAKERASEYREEIKSLMAELDAIADVVQEGAEERAQMDLTFTEAEAAKALAGVGTAACTCQGHDVKAGEIGEPDPDPACPVHGVETRGENPAVDDQGPIPLEGGMEFPVRTPVNTDGPEVAAAYVVPEAEHVEVETPGEPAAVTEFHRAKAKRARARA